MRKIKDSTIKKFLSRSVQGEISIQQAQTQANLAKQANNAMVCALRKAEMFLKHNN